MGNTGKHCYKGVMQFNLSLLNAANTFILPLNSTFSPNRTCINENANPFLRGRPTCHRLCPNTVLSAAGRTCSLDLILYRLYGSRYFILNHVATRSMSVRSSFYDVGLQGRLKEPTNLFEQCGGLLGNILINVSKEKMLLQFLVR